MESNSKVEATIEIIRKRLRGEEEMKPELGTMEYIIDRIHRSYHKGEPHDREAVTASTRGIIQAIADFEPDRIYTARELRELFDEMHELTWGKSKED